MTVCVNFAKTYLSAYMHLHEVVINAYLDINDYTL